MLRMTRLDELLKATISDVPVWTILVLPIWDDDPSLYDGAINLYSSRGIDPDPYPKRLSLEGMGR